MRDVMVARERARYFSATWRQARGSRIAALAPTAIWFNTLLPPPVSPVAAMPRTSSATAEPPSMERMALRLAIWASLRPTGSDEPAPESPPPCAGGENASARVVVPEATAAAD